MDHQPLDHLSHNPTSPSAGLLAVARRVALEEAVSGYLGRPWRVTGFIDLIDLASHGAAVLSGPGAAVFAKLGEAANTRDQFEAELGGLRCIMERSGAPVPAPIGLVSVPATGGLPQAEILLLEAVESVPRGPQQWREIGHTLARIHAAQGATWGFERQGYFGPLYQDNRPMPDWLSFFSERRVWPWLAAAIDSGHLSGEAIRRVERLLARLPRLEIPDSSPCLLHGDAQANNFISTAAGALAIDPAVYYGHPEMDLAYLDIFQQDPAAAAAALEGYRELRPIAPGFAARRSLWRVPACLALVAAGGPAYLEMLTQAVGEYL